MGITEIKTDLPANENLVGELERLLGWAKEGKLVGLATISVWHTGNTGNGWNFPDADVDTMRLLGACVDLSLRLREEINSHPENFDNSDDPVA